MPKRGGRQAANSGTGALFRNHSTQVRDGSKNEMIPSGAGAFHSLYQLAAAIPGQSEICFCRKIVERDSSVRGLSETVRALRGAELCRSLSSVSIPADRFHRRAR